MNLLDRYKRWTRKQYNKYYFEYDFKPNFKWNPFDTNNDFVFDNEKWYDFLSGWIGVGYAWESWTSLMRNVNYSHKIPEIFWAEMNDGWMSMYVWNKK